MCPRKYNAASPSLYFLGEVDKYKRMNTKQSRENDTHVARSPNLPLQNDPQIVFLGRHAGRPLRYSITFSRHICQHLDKLGVTKSMPDASLS